MRPVYESRFFWSYTAAQITIAITLSMAVFVLTVWWRRRMQLDYGLFGLACLFWGLHTLNYVIEVVPDAWWLFWRVMRYAATGGFAASITLFYLRFAGFRPPCGACGLGEIGGVAQVTGEGGQVAGKDVDVMAQGIDPAESDNHGGGRQCEDEQAGKITSPDRPDEGSIFWHAQPRTLTQHFSRLDYA